MSLRTRITIWLLNHGLIRRKPWDDPRRSPVDRAAWLRALPKSIVR